MAAEGSRNSASTDGRPSVEPIPDAPAATVRLEGSSVLLIADYHAGIESAFRAQGISVESRAEERRERVLDLLARTDPDRLVVLGDLMHSIGGPSGAEREELEALIDAVEVPTTVAKGNHDGDLESWLPGVTVSGTGGFREGGVGFAHGHAWPDPAALEGEVLCIGHEHPVVRVTDAVGGARIEPAWLRGPLERDPFLEGQGGDDQPGAWCDPELVVVPAFNDLVGGTRIGDDDFLSPFLPAALPAGEVYLLDGTCLGDYRRLSESVPPRR